MTVKKFSAYSNQSVVDDAAKMLWENPAATNSYHQTFLQLEDQLISGFTDKSPTFLNVNVIDTLKTDAISEYTTDSGIDIEGMTHKGGKINNTPFSTNDTNQSTYFGVGQNKNGDQDTYFGYRAGQSSNSDAFGNAFFGHRAGNANAGNDKNTYIGGAAGELCSGGSDNTYLGFQAGRQNTNGDRNVAISYRAGILSSGSNNILIGYEAGYNTVGNNVIIGYSSGRDNTGSGNVFIGYNAAYSETGSNKLYIENSNSATPLIYGEFDNDLVQINGDLDVTGVYKLDGITVLNTPDINNTLVGKYAGNAGPTANTVCVGYEAGYSNTQGQSVYIGFRAGRSNVSGWDNTFIGYNAGQNSVSGSRNFYSGASAGSNSTGSDNIFIGYQTGANNTGEKNVFIGGNSGLDSTSGVNNVFVGHLSGGENITGDSNVFLGYVSGLNNISGSGNVFIGNSSGLNETGSNKLYIENSSSATPLIYGEFDNDLIQINGDLIVTDFFKTDAIAIKRTASAVDYNPSALTIDSIISITDTSIARTVTISTEDIQSGSTANPRIFVVKDESGGAGTNNITVQGESGNIDGVASISISTNYESMIIYADGTNLWTMKI